MVTSARLKKASMAASPIDGISTATAMQGTAQHCSASVLRLRLTAFLRERRKRADSSRSRAAMAVASSTNGSRNSMTGDLRNVGLTA